MKFWSETILTMFLALSVLAGSVMPPAFAHSHAAGDATHEHTAAAGRADHSHGHHHAHPHGAGHHHHHDHAPATTEHAVPQTLHDHTPHWHITFWFVDLNFPSLPTPEGDSTVDGQLPVVVAPLVDPSQAAQIDDAAALPAGLDTANVHPTDAVVVTSAGPVRRTASCRTLLCDTARRERSGVLLT